MQEPLIKSASLKDAEPDALEQLMLSTKSYKQSFMRKDENNLRLLELVEKNRKKKEYLEIAN